MRYIRTKLSALGVIRFLGIICLCTVLMFSSAFPAYSNPLKDTSSYGASSTSNPAKGEDQLVDIEKNTWESLRPENTFSPDKLMEKANEGINEVQGAADINKMKRPSNSQNATTVEDQVRENLAKIQNNTKN